MLIKAIDSLLLARETDFLCRRYQQLKDENEIKAEELRNLESQLNDCRYNIQSKLTQIVSLNERIRELSGLESDCVNCEEVRKTLLFRVSQVRDEIKELDRRKQTVNLEIQNLRDSLTSVKCEIDREINAIRQQKQSDLQAELETLELQQSQALEESYQAKATALEEGLQALEAEGRARAEEVRASVETATIQTSQAIEGLGEEVRAWEQKIEELERNYRAKQTEIKNQAIELANIEIEKRKLALDHEKIENEKRFSFEKHKIIEEFKPKLVAPYLQQINSLEEEIVRLNSLLTAKSGKVFVWTLEQIRAFMVKERNGRLEPNHLRIAGESESGKSHTVNQFITEGLQHFGVYCDYEILDPFPSQTEWKVKPTISNNPEGVLERLKHWEEICNDETPGLEKPLIIVIDEIDRMILKFGKETVSALRSIWGGGRHKSIFLWAIGQNANVKKLAPLDWSDLDNCAQIYLNSSALQYIKNGLDGQDTKRLEGELKHVKKQTKFYAVVKVKGLDPYAIARPYNLFSSDKPPGKVEEISQALQCSHCLSTDVKKDGKLNGKQRVYCKSCGKKGPSLSPSSPRP
jgi:hypothetical protein